MKNFTMKTSLLDVNNLIALMLTIVCVSIFLPSQWAMADDIDRLLEKQKAKANEKSEKQNREKQRMKAAAARVDEVATIVGELLGELQKRGFKLTTLSSSGVSEGECEGIRYSNKLWIENNGRCGKYGLRGEEYGSMFFVPKGMNSLFIGIDTTENYDSEGWRIPIHWSVTGIYTYNGRYNEYVVEFNSIFDSKELKEKRDVLKNNILKVFELGLEDLK